MVDVSQLMTINTLLAQFQQTELAIKIVGDNARITSMVVSNSSGGEFGNSTTVDTSNMPHPQQMLTAIEGYLKERADGLRTQLRALGVTGFEGTGPVATVAAAQTKRK